MSIEQLADDLYSTVDTEHCAVGGWYDLSTGCMCPIAQVAVKKGLVTEGFVKDMESSAELSVGNPLSTSQLSPDPRAGIRSEQELMDGLRSEEELMEAVARHYDIDRNMVMVFYEDFDSYGEDWDVDVALELAITDLLNVFEE